MPKTPASTMPGMTDTLDFVKNLWGSMNIPGTGMPGMSGLTGPALSTDDLDKRIADLKAVESWLNMNIGMLRGTIQAMEVQRGTLAALKSMGASMAEAMRQSDAGTDKMAAMPFAAFFAPPAQGAPAKPSDAAAAAPAAGAGSATAQPGTASAGTDAGAAAPGMPAAMAWWNLLQDQFTQAVTTAMSSAAAPAPAPAGATAPAPAPAPADGGAAPAPSPSSASQPSQAAPDAGGPGGNGSGKPRTPRSRADKA